MNRINRNWLIIGGGIVATLALAAIIVVAVIWFVTQGASGVAAAPAPEWVNPLDKIETKEVKPITALRVLAGEGDETVIQDALAAGELETALATLGYSTVLPDSNRLGLLIQLAQAYAGANNADKANLCYERAGDTATLSGYLNDYVRANAYVQIGQGLRELGNTGRAKAFYDQAYVVVAFSPTLRPEHRSVILGALAHEYAALGNQPEAEQLSWESQVPSFHEVKPGESFTGVPLGAMPQSEAVDAAIKQRQEAAQTLIQALSEDRAVADRQQALEQALLTEDTARLEFYDAQLASSANSAGVKVQVSRAKLEWLTTKWRIARRGFGLSLVADWENNEPVIAEALKDTLETFDLAASDLIVASPTQAELTQGKVDLLRGEILWGRLGLHPGFVEQALVSDLQAATSELVVLRGAQTLYVEVLPPKQPYNYILISADLYGRGESPAPVAQSTSVARATSIASLPTPTLPPAPTMEPPQVTAILPTATPGETPVTEPTALPTATVEQTPATPTPTNTPEPTATAQVTNTPTPSPTATASPTRTNTPTRTPKPTGQASPTPRPPTPTPTPSQDIILVKMDGPIGYPAGANACNKPYGHVLDKDGKPLNGVTVKAFNEYGIEFSDITGPRPGESRDDGYFEFCVERGGWSINVIIADKTAQNAWVAFDDPNFIGHVEWDITFQVVR